MTVLVDALVKYTSPACIHPYVPRVLSPSCPDIGLPSVNLVQLQADLVRYIMMNLPGAAADAQYFWENALEPCLGVFFSIGSAHAEFDIVTREEPPMDVTPYFAMLGELWLCAQETSFTQVYVLPANECTSPVCIESHHSHAHQCACWKGPFDTYKGHIMHLYRLYCQTPCTFSVQCMLLSVDSPVEPQRQEMLIDSLIDRSIDRSIV